MSKTVLALCAHPDDAEFRCAGTLILLAQQGWQVHIATLTCGDMGSTEMMPGAIARTRRAEAEVVKVWNSLLDPTITAHAQPTGVRKGTLFVSVDSNVWLSEIVRYRRKEILDRLQHSFGRELIGKISFRVG